MDKKELTELIMKLADIDGVSGNEAAAERNWASLFPISDAGARGNRTCLLTPTLTGWGLL